MGSSGRHARVVRRSADPGRLPAALRNVLGPWPMQDSELGPRRAPAFLAGDDAVLPRRAVWNPEGTPAPPQLRGMTTATTDSRKLRAANYALVSTSQKSQCSHCKKTVRLVGDRLMKHANRVGERCAGSGEGAEESADRGQDTENQLLQLREYCACQGWTIAIEYVDRMSGKTGDRETFKRLFIDASRRQFDVVVVWELDRFMRGGVLETFEYIATSPSPVSSSRARLTSAPAGQRTDARRRGGDSKARTVAD